MTRRLMITVDVEAQPRRASKAPLERLIWGRLPEGQAGISEMMDIAERHGAALTMFLDYAEEHLYGEELLDVGREIHRRGHDLELHLHPQFLSADRFPSLNPKTVWNLANVDTDAAGVLTKFACDAHQRAIGIPPVAFRGGGYRYGAPLLREFAARGVMVDSSYNPAKRDRPMPGNSHVRAQFKWVDGPFEIPISTVENFEGRSASIDYNFNTGIFLNGNPDQNADKHLQFLEHFYADHGEDAIAVLVMHSWSLLQLDDDGVFSSLHPDGADKLDRLIACLGNATEIVTARQAHELLSVGKVDEGPAIQLSQVQVHSFPRRPASNNSAPAGGASSKSSCSVCGVDRKDFQDADDAGRRCRCGSLERQRVFADLHRMGEFDLAGVKLLAVAPSVSELRLFEEFGVKEVTSVDVRPETKPDLVADVCDMPEVQSNSFDAVLASYVLCFVYDVDKCLAEFARVLVPGGRLFASDQVNKIQPTREISDRSEISAWYGEEALEQYRVGRFRKLGELDLRRQFERHFDLRVRTSIDGPTGTPVVWHVGTVKHS